MRVERYSARRRQRGSAGCTCLSLLGAGGVLFVIGIAVLSPLLNRAFLQAAGLEAEGDTAAIFAGNTPVATIEAVSGGQPAGITLQLAGIGTQSLQPQGAGYSIVTGNDARGQVLQANFNEAALQTLCNQYTDFCNAAGTPFRNARFDVRAGGGIITGDVYIEQTGLWQTVSVVVQINENGRVSIAGIDRDGTLYRSAPDGTLATLFTEAEALLNTGLQQLTIDAAGVRYRVDSVYTDEQTLSITLR